MKEILLCENLRYKATRLLSDRFLLPIKYKTQSHGTCRFINTLTTQFISGVYDVFRRCVAEHFSKTPRKSFVIFLGPSLSMTLQCRETGHAHFLENCIKFSRFNHHSVFIRHLIVVNTRSVQIRALQVSNCEKIIIVHKRNFRTGMSRHYFKVLSPVIP